jgi:hypothetical protein
MLMRYGKLVAAAAVVLGLATAGGATAGDLPSTTQLTPDYQRGPVLIPPQIPGPAGLAADILFADPAANRVYLSDIANGEVDVWDARSGVLLGTIKGFAVDHVGPLGVLVDDMHQVWAGNGDGTVKVASSVTFQQTDSIATGGVNRADELAYDPKDKIIIITNPAEGTTTNPTPYVTLIDARPGHHKVLGHVFIPGAGIDTVEQPQYDPVSGKFMLNVRMTTAVPNGQNGAVAVIDPRARKLVWMRGLTSFCSPAGLTIGPNNEALLGCDSAPPVIINRTSGAIVTTIPNACCADEVWYNAADGRYYVAEAGNPDNNNSTNPVVMVVDAQTHAFVTNIPIRDSTGAPDARFHTVTAAYADSHVYVLQQDGVHVWERVPVVVRTHDDDDD